MSSLDPLLRELEGAASGLARPAGDDHTWNVMVQVLLPLVFVLTFVVVTGLMVYKAAYKVMRDVIRRDSKYAEIAAQERLVDVQLQKLLLALEAVKTERRGELNVSMFPRAARITRRGVKLGDADFQLLCRRSAELFDEDARSARLRFADEIYRQVLVRAKVDDPSALTVQRWSARTTDAQDMVDSSQIMSAEGGVVVSINRRFIHNAILDFLDGLEEQVVNLEVELLQQVFDDLLATGSGETLDPASRRILAEILDPSTPETERRRAAEQLYRGLLERWRERFDEAGYPFLDRTWGAVQG